MLLSGTRGRGLSQHLGLSLSSDPSLIPLESKKHFFSIGSNPRGFIYCITEKRSKRKGGVHACRAGVVAGAGMCGVKRGTLQAKFKWCDLGQVFSLTLHLHVSSAQ